MSDPPLSDIDFKYEMACVYPLKFWLNYSENFILFLELRCGRERKHYRGRFDQMDEPAWEIFDKITS